MTIVTITSTPTVRSLQKRSKSDLIQRIVELHQMLEWEAPDRVVLRTRSNYELAHEVINLMRQLPEDEEPS